MKSIDALASLQKLKQPFFKTADAAACWNSSNAHASKILARLADANQLKQISRALWGFSGADPLECVAPLSAPWPSYISLQTALFYHGMISQIPATIYAVTLGRTKKTETPFGRISFHHCPPSFFYGFEARGNKNILMAEPEKALLDIWYLKPARSGLFQTLPELTLPKNFSKKKLRQMIQKIPSRRQRTLVEKEFKKLFQTAK